MSIKNVIHFGCINAETNRTRTYVPTNLCRYICAYVHMCMRTNVISALTTKLTFICRTLVFEAQKLVLPMYFCNSEKLPKVNNHRVADALPLFRDHASISRVCLHVLNKVSNQLLIDHGCGRIVCFPCKCGNIRVNQYENLMC
jgi:hypothetical protein